MIVRADHGEMPEQQCARHRAPAYIHHTSAGEKHSPKQLPQKRDEFFLLGFGVFIPVVLILIETSTHICAQSYFDPLPSIGYVMLVALIPLSNFLFWLACKRDLSEYYAFMTLASGLAVGAAIVYSFIALTHITECSLSVFVLLTTLSALYFSWTASTGICALADIRKVSFEPSQLKELGHLIVIVAIVTMELPSTITRIYLAQADSANKRVSLAAIKWLRAYGDREVLLRACYERCGGATDVIGSLVDLRHPSDVEINRSIYYRVTGTEFNTVPIPDDMRATMTHTGLILGNAVATFMNRRVSDEFALDPDIAGSRVSGIARGLELTKSAITGTVDNDYAVAEMTWHLELINTAGTAHEARAKIILPAGAIVDRASLTIHGRTREAVITDNKSAKQRYASSMVHGLDPLLVSFAGTNEVLMQCYPVAASSVVEIALHVVAPVVVAHGKSNGSLALPAFAEKNFKANFPLIAYLAGTKALGIASPADAQPITWEPSSGSLAGDLLPREKLKQHLTFRINRGDLREGIIPVVSVERAQFDDFYFDTAGCYCLGGGGDIFELAYPMLPIMKQEVDSFVPKHLHVVIDGSQRMAKYIDQIAAGLKLIPESIPVDITLVGDSERQWSNLKTNTREFESAISELVQKDNFVAGQDSGPVLRKLSQRWHRDGSHQFIWIHAAQPIPVRHPAALCRNSLLTCYDLPVCAGPDAIADLNSENWIRLGTEHDVTESIKNLCCRWRFRGRDALQLPTATEPTNTYLVKLAAKKQIDHDYFCGEYDSRNMTEASLLAQSKHLVSPVSSLLIYQELDCRSHQPSPLPRSVYTPTACNLLKSSNERMDSSSSRAAFASNSHKFASSGAALKPEESTYEPVRVATVPDVRPNLANLRGIVQSPVYYCCQQSVNKSALKDRSNFSAVGDTSNNLLQFLFGVAFTTAICHYLGVILNRIERAQFGQTKVSKPQS